MSNGKDIGEAIVAIGAGILGGIALGALLSYLLGDRCPVCNRPIPRGVNQCPHCHTALRWD